MDGLPVLRPAAEITPPAPTMVTFDRGSLDHMCLPVRSHEDYTRLPGEIASWSYLTIPSRSYGKISTKP